MAVRRTPRRESGGDVASSFFRSRLRVPAVPEHYLRRPRLLQLLDEAARAPITSVVAPAGSGKTSLLVDWCSTSTAPTAWLSLDETDRDGGQLWTAVAAALAELVEGLGGRASPANGSGLAPGGAWRRSWPRSRSASIRHQRCSWWTTST